MGRRVVDVETPNPDCEACGGTGTLSNDAPCACNYEVEEE